MACLSAGGLEEEEAPSSGGIQRSIQNWIGGASRSPGAPKVVAEMFKTLAGEEVKINALRAQLIQVKGFNA